MGERKSHQIFSTTGWYFFFYFRLSGGFRVGIYSLSGLFSGEGNTVKPAPTSDTRFIYMASFSAKSEVPIMRYRIYDAQLQDSEYFNFFQKKFLLCIAGVFRLHLQCLYTKLDDIGDISRISIHAAADVCLYVSIFVWVCVAKWQLRQQLC